MMPQQVKVADITDERSAQTYLDQMLMTTFCRVLDTSRLPPAAVMRLMASALGAAYRDVAAAHRDGLCPCGWSPSPGVDVEAMCTALEDSAAPKRADDLGAMVIAGRA